MSVQVSVSRNALQGKEAAGSGDLVVCGRGWLGTVGGVLSS